MSFASRVLVATNNACNARMCTVTIVQPENGRITANCNGITYSTSFVVPYGARVNFICTPNSGYAFVSFSTKNNGHSGGAS